MFPFLKKVNRAHLSINFISVIFKNPVRYILRSLWMNGVSWRQGSFLKLQSKLFLAWYFQRASELTKQKEEGTNNKGEKQALARGRQACMEHAIMWQEVWIWITKLYSNFFLGKKVQWNRPTYHWKWHKCWLVLLNRRKLNWWWFFSFKKQLIAKNIFSPAFQCILMLEKFDDSCNWTKTCVIT